MQQESKEIKILKKLGYDPNDEAFKLLVDVIYETCEVLKESSYEDVKKMIQNRGSHIYIEPKVYHEVGLNRFMFGIQRLHEERNVDKIDMEMHANIFGENISESPKLSDTIFNIAKFINEKTKSNRAAVKELTA